jgi:phosphoribosyl 1,2-cyclic phosphodiesterase
VGVNVTILGSGSAGNCALVASDSTCLLIDAGLSGRQIRERLAALGRSVEQLHAIVLTHEHGDHTRGLPVLCKERPIPVYANRLTAEAVTQDLDRNRTVAIAWRVFATGHSFPIGDLTVESFSVPHDAQDPVNFVIRQNSHAIGVLTDLGHVTKLVVDRVRAMDVLIVEANHDVKMLQDDTARPWATKQRILSRHGHLSNEAAAALAGEAVSDRLRQVFLAHLSRDCNHPALAQRVVTDRLAQLGARHVRVTVAAQDTPTPTFAL